MRASRRIELGVLGGMLVVVMAPAIAADGMRMRDLGEGLEVGASLALAHVYSDNFYYQPANPRSVEGLVINPALALQQKFGRGSIRLDVEGHSAEFDLLEKESDYDNLLIASRFHYDGGVRSDFTFGVRSRRGHDPFGVDRTAGQAFLGLELDKWTLNTVNGRYRYGAPTATLNVEFEAEHSTKDYTSNEPQTDPLDYQRTEFTQTLFFNYSPKTAVVLELGETFVNFDIEPAPNTSRDRDAVELRARTGLRWKATAKTQGDLRLGAVRRRLDDDRFDAITGVSWRADVTWEPLKRTDLKLTSARSSQESFSEQFAVIDSRRTGLVLTQRLSPNLRMTLGGNVVESRFVGTDRVDDFDSYGLTLIYAIRNSLSLYLEAQHLERDSTRDDLDFETVSGLIGVRFSP
jgi:polysaccharide biosynthesis protein VpsM